MKIAIIGPGIMAIPPKGWGAVEILIHDMRCALEDLGHDVYIVNVKNKNEIIQQTNKLDAEFVHIQYDDHVDIIPHLTCKNIAITSHYGYLEQPYRWDHGYKRIANQFLKTNVNIFALSPGIANLYKQLISINKKIIHPSMNEDNVFVAHNGVRDDLFKFSETCKFPKRTIYLAKIDFRKRQYLFQSISNLYFAGNIADNRFNINSSNYLGEWNKKYLYDNLTNYANLALLSDGEAHPLVCMEALAAGLGLVISEYATANLDITKPFIDVIPESKINDINYVSKILKENAEKSILMRNEIKNYSKEFSWKKVIKNIYIPTVQNIIGKK